MAEKELEKKWEKFVKKAFKDFIKENVGYKKGDGGAHTEDLPACYGAGGGSDYCDFCPYSGSC